MKFAIKASIVLGIAIMPGFAVLCFTQYWPLGALGLVVNAILLALNIRKLRALQ